MKKLLVGFLLSLSLPSWALDGTNSTLQGAFGARTAVGVIGVDYQKMFTEHHAFQVGLGVDIIGVVGSIGYRYFGDAIPKVVTPDSVWGKCFFLFECDTYPFIGASVMQASASTFTITEAQVESKYKVNERILGLALVGLRSVFKSHVVMDVGISYRSLLTKSELQNTSGPDVEKQKADFHGYEQGTGIVASVGYMF
jgi:hypothetical protein